MITDIICLDKDKSHSWNVINHKERSLWRCTDGKEFVGTVEDLFEHIDSLNWSVIGECCQEKNKRKYNKKNSAELSKLCKSIFNFKYFTKSISINVDEGRGILTINYSPRSKFSDNKEFVLKHIEDKALEIARKMEDRQLFLQIKEFNEKRIIYFF